MPNEQPTQTPPAEPQVTPPAATTPPAPEKKTVLQRGLKSLGLALAATPPATPAATTPAANETPTEPATPPATNAEPQAAEAAPAAPAGAPAAAPAPAGECEAAPAAPAAPADTTPRVRKVKAAAAPAPTPSVTDIVTAIKEAFPKQPASASAPAASPQDDEAKLPEPDREELEFARYAAKADERFKDYPERYLEFVKARDAFVQKQVAESGGFDPNSEEFRDFVRTHRPPMPMNDRRKLERQMVKEEVKAEAMKEVEEKQLVIERRIKASEIAPIIQQAASAVEQGVLLIDDPVVKAFAEDPKKAAEEHKLEAPIIAAAVHDARVLTQEYIRIAEGVVDANLEKNEVHRELDKFISAQGKHLDALPVEQRTMADGKILVSPLTLLQMAERKDPNIGRYRTFSDTEIVAMIEEGGRLRITGQLSAKRKELEDAGYVRKEKAPAKPAAPTGVSNPPAAAKPTPPAAPAAPKATSSPAAPAPSTPPPKTTVSRGVRALGFNK